MTRGAMSYLDDGHSCDYPALAPPESGKRCVASQTKENEGQGSEAKEERRHPYPGKVRPKWVVFMVAGEAVDKQKRHDN